MCNNTNTSYKCALILVLIVCYSTFVAQVCDCKPTTKKANQHRSVAKHETAYGDFPLKKKFVDIKYIAKWENKYAATTSSITIGASKETSLRWEETPEDTLYTLKGYMWFVSQEENDCDFHIEIGGYNGNATRIVVEVARENQFLQKKIKKYLDDHDLKIKDCNGSGDTHFPKGIQVLVTGLGFYDKSHKPDTNHGDAHTKKYSWELHPVMDIEFLNE
jgi:hypothetical protein